MPENWKHYFSRLNGAQASIAVDVGLGKEAPIGAKPWLIWVRVFFNSPRADGLSSSEEAPVLFAIEDALLGQLSTRCCAIECGRTTARAERVFYFYAAAANESGDAVKDAMKAFPEYRFECGEQSDATWSNYLKVLYPSEEAFQLIGNGDVLGQLIKGGDTLSREREVTHWIYFSSRGDRTAFSEAVGELGYRIDVENKIKAERPYSIRISRTHAVTPNVIDGVVLELFRLAKKLGGEYDGWETEQIKP